jgi:uncharacterized protein (TIGR03435 family)
MRWILQAILVVWAQQPVFEVASIKPSRPGPAGGVPRVAADGRRFIASNATLRMLLQFAYRPADGRALRNADLIGAPDWTDTNRFDIEAKAADGVPPMPPEQMQRMVQSLLMDRFQLRTHWDQRDNMDIYNLVVAKDGSKLTPSEDQAPPDVGASIAVPFSPSSFPPRGQVRNLVNPSGGIMLVTASGAAVPVSPDLVGVLQGYARRPVVDKTNLKGLFDFRLQFVLDTGTTGPVIQAAPAASDPSGASFFTALQEQLGLRLEPSKGTIEVLVVDSVQKPSEN